jgi:hypothetical protein
MTVRDIGHIVQFLLASTRLAQVALSVLWERGIFGSVRVSGLRHV